MGWVHLGLIIQEVMSLLGLSSSPSSSPCLITLSSNREKHGVGLGDREQHMWHQLMSLHPKHMLIYKREWQHFLCFLSYCVFYSHTLKLLA